MAGLEDISLGNFTNVFYGDAGTDDPTNKLGEVQSVGDISDEATIVDVQKYGQKYLRKLVGSANAAPIEVVCNFKPNDAGQIDLLKAYNETTTRRIKIDMDENDTGSNGTTNQFDVLVGSASVTNSFDETRTITFALVPIDGIGDYVAKT